MSEGGREGMSDFYRLFDCTSKEALKEKLRYNDKSVASLNSLYDKLKNDIEQNRPRIHGTHTWKNFFNDSQYIPEEGKYGVIKLNTKLNVLGYNTFDQETDKKEAYKYLFDGDTVSYALVVNEPGAAFDSRPFSNEEGMRAEEKKRAMHREILDFANDFKKDISMLNHVDIVIADEHSGKLLSGHMLLGAQTSDIGKIDTIDDFVGQNNRKTFHVNYGLTDEEQCIYHSEQFKDFTQEHAKEKIKTLNIIEDEDALVQHLKLGNQHLSSEHFSLITYDQNFNITDYHTISVGGTKSTIVDIKSFAPLITDDNVQGVAVYHNHPSGHPDPSDADKEMTARIIDFANIFDKQVYDHCIIGSSSVQKLSEDRSLWNLSERKSNIISEYKASHQLEMLSESEKQFKELNKDMQEPIEGQFMSSEEDNRLMSHLEPVNLKKIYEETTEQSREDSLNQKQIFQVKLENSALADQGTPAEKERTHTTIILPIKETNLRQSLMDIGVGEYINGQQANKITIKHIENNTSIPLPKDLNSADNLEKLNLLARRYQSFSNNQLEAMELLSGENPQQLDYLLNDTEQELDYRPDITTEEKLGRSDENWLIGVLIVKLK